MTDEQLLACIPYLHGCVVDGQFRAACHYEYARESNILRRAAELFGANQSALAGEIFFQIDREFPAAAGNWLITQEWSFVWQCRSFPATSWNELSEAERTELLHGLPLPTNETRPLVLGEVMFLTPYLDQLKEKAEKARAELKRHVAAETRAAKARAEGKKKIPTVRRSQKVYPILELPNTPFVQGLLPLDFSKSKKRLLQEIGKWLNLPENKARFEKHKRKTEAGTEKQAKDRLKDLAAWRLCLELGCDEALSFAEKNRKRDKFGSPRPFHDWRQGQIEKLPPNEAPLYSEESGFSKAKKRAESYLAELIPWELVSMLRKENSKSASGLLPSDRR
jgi:hypothetical protein